jgi:glutathione S-transferase
MANEYHIHGIELSPYSVKIRSYFRYKKLPHKWIPRSLDADGEYQKYVKLPLVPLVVTPDNQGIQDSTPIIERVEALHPEPSIHPTDPVAKFISALLEEFGDEWGNKWMFHYRWAREADVLSAAGRIACSMMPTADDAQLAKGIATVRERMVPRVSFVGSNPATAPQIEDSFLDTLAILEPHFANRAYLFGSRPAFADFGIWGQLYNAWTDPTPGAIINATSPNLLAWIHRMLWPGAQGDFEPWSTLAPTLTPLLERQVGRLFMPWTVANADAIASGKEEFSVELGGRAWTQKPQKYHAKSLATLREKYQAVADNRALNAILDSSGCLSALREK